jgi:hypothetical protein
MSYMNNPATTLDNMHNTRDNMATPGSGAISSVNFLQNKIGIDQAKALASMLKEHSTLQSLCGNTGDETELDMRSKEMDAGDVIMLAAEIVDNRALLSLDMSNTYL